jgi:hypothetical protein
MEGSQMKIRLLSWMVTVVMLTVLVSFGSQVFATDVNLIKIDFDKTTSKAVLAPETVNVPKDTIIVWFNNIADQEVQVVFNEGKVCKDVTTNPNEKMASFSLTSRNCYVTSFLPYCATSTLQFPDVGKYEYKVVSADGKLEAAGAIVVGP